MKKNLLFIILSISWAGLAAQTNLNFETWSNKDPQGWISYNFLPTFYAPQSTFKDSVNPGEGNASVKMVTVSCPNCASFGINDTLGGSVTSGAIVGTSAKLGWAYTGRPTSVDFKFKANPGAGDAGVFMVQLSKWNGSQQVVGQGIFVANATVSTWTDMNLPIQYASADTPDTLLIMASSSASTAVQGLPDGGVPAMGSEFFLDAIVINSPAGISKIDFEDGISFFPNPASGEITFNIPDKNASAIVIYDITGKVISTVDAELRTTVSLDSYPQGIYFYQVSAKDGEKIQSGKFNVVK